MRWWALNSIPDAIDVILSATSKAVLICPLAHAGRVCRKRGDQQEHREMASQEGAAKNGMRLADRARAQTLCVAGRLRDTGRRVLSSWACKVFNLPVCGIIEAWCADVHGRAARRCGFVISSPQTGVPIESRNCAMS
jgi:hypothetical protein